MKNLHAQIVYLIKEYGGVVPNPFTPDDLVAALKKLLECKQRAILDKDSIK